MKRSLFILVGFAVMVACAKKNNDSGTVAAVPLTTNCLNNPQACNGNMYGQYPGFAPYPGGYGYGYGYSYGYGYGSYGGSGDFCACQSTYGYGVMAVYHNSWGLGCMSSQVYAPIAGIMGIYGMSSANQHWVNIPQVSNLPASSCSQVAQACTPGQVNTCGNGYHCQATSGSASIGLCVLN